VPARFRPLARERFKKRPAYPVMMDWEGSLAAGFDYRRNEGNAFALDRKGVVAGRFSGATNETASVSPFLAVDTALANRH
jgi:hypothetical protein